MEYFPHEKIDKLKWDICIANAFNATPYAYSNYLDLVSPNWDALISKNYSTVLPLTKRNKYGVEYICQPLFAPQLGAFSTITTNNFCVDEYIAAIPSKFKIIDLALNPYNYIINPDLEINCKNLVSQKLNLNKPYEEIKQFYKYNHILNIHKFEKKGLVYNIGELTPADFYHNKIVSIQHNGNWITEADKTIFHNLLLHFSELNKLKIIAGFNRQHKPIGAVAFFFYDNHIFFQSFNTMAGRKCGLIFYLIDDMIKKHSGKPLYLDFMGSSIAGVKYRNSGFGSTDVAYTRVTINRLPKFFSLFRK